MLAMSWENEASFALSVSNHSQDDTRPSPPTVLFSRKRWLLFVFAQCICVLMAPSSSPRQPTGKTVGDDLIRLIAGKQCEQPKARDKPGVTTAAKHCLMGLSSTEAYASLEDLLQSACVLPLHT